MRVYTIYLYTLAIALLPLCSIAQLPSITWQKSLGGTNMENGTSIHQTADGGYIAAGYTTSEDGDVTGLHGGKDMWVVKLDSGGNMQWQKCLGGSGDEWVESIRQTYDGGYIVIGTTCSGDGDVSGIHSYAIASSYLADVWVVKLKPTGDIEWQRCLGGTDNEEGYDILQTSDSGYVFTGHFTSIDGDITSMFTSCEGWAVKLSKSGTIQWQHYLGIGYWSTPYESGLSMAPSPDGGCVIAGFTNAADMSTGEASGVHGGEDAWIMRLNAAGNVLWHKCIGTDFDEYASSIASTADSGYIFVYNKAYTGIDSPQDGGYVYIVKMNAHGEVIWTQSNYSGWLQRLNSVQQVADGGYIVAGTTSSGINAPTTTNSFDYWILKFKPNGEAEWQKCFGGTGKDVANAVEQTSDGGYIVIGTGASNDGGQEGLHGPAFAMKGDMWVLKLNTPAATPTVMSPVNDNAAYLYPNPAQNTVHIDNAHLCTWYKITGVADATIITGIPANGKSIDISALPTGVYSVELGDANGTSQVIKLIKE